MIFWICLICAIALAFVGKELFNSWNSIKEIIGFTFIIASTILAFIVIIMFIFGICNYIDAPINQAKLMTEYEVLTYQLDNNFYDNDIELGRTNLYQNIMEYNAKVSAGKTAQRNFWVGILYPNIYDDIPLIELGAA